MGRRVTRLRDYAAISEQYARGVMSGRIPACVYVRRACLRQIKDLGRKRFKWRFDPDRAAHICRFVELLPHIKGEWARAGRRIRLEPWQIFLLTVVFGWVDRNGLRRFKIAYIEVPRKNAKSTLSSGVALYLLAADQEEGAEVYSAATTRDQARIVWTDAKRMVDRTRGLRGRFSIETAAHSVYIEKTSSWFKPLSRDQGGNLDGLNVHGAIIDELHAHKTRDIWDVIDTATGARSQPLIWAITTAGANRAGICYEQRAYALRVLAKPSIDQEFFGVVYTKDDADDWMDESTWAKANPNWGVSVNPDDIRRKARKAQQMAAATNNFLTKHLCEWVNADMAWMSMAAWHRCADESLVPENFAGCECWIAADLATKTDIASIALLFRRDGEYYLFMRHYLNEEAAEDGRNSQYSGWARDGHLLLTQGNVTDFGVIEEDVRGLCAQFSPRDFSADPWQASYMLQRLGEDGLPVIEYRQTVQNMSGPMKELEAVVLSGKLHHAGDPVMDWMIGNVVGHFDAKDNIYPRKEFPENKIDGAVAAMMAFGRAMVLEDSGSVYEDRGVRFL